MKRYKVVFNGHIHKPSIFENVINVGSITTHSFSDDNDFIPQCYIFNTETMKMENVIQSTACPLFRKIEITNEEDLNNKISEFRSMRYYKFVLQVTCSYNIKEDIKQILDNTDIIVSYRLSVKINKADNEINKPVIESFNNIDIKQNFNQFLETLDLKYPLDVYKTVLEEVNGRPK